MKTIPNATIIIVDQTPARKVAGVFLSSVAWGLKHTYFIDGPDTGIYRCEQVIESFWS